MELRVALMDSKGAPLRRTASLKVVAIGGGTGLSWLLRGLKRHVSKDLLPADTLEISDLKALVTVTDEGGSSGRLRRELNALPPGDIRNCMVALSEDEALLSRLFDYRFSAGRGLKGHSFGNLFLTALSHVTGDFAQAVGLSGEILAIRGRILPSTNVRVRLEAELVNGRRVLGETSITRSPQPIRRVGLVPSEARPLPETLAALHDADLITVGPGSLYTSLIPNLLVQGVAREIARSRACRVYICNLMTQPNETLHYTAADHLRALFDHAGEKLFDWVVLNSAPLSPRLRRRYLAEHAAPVVNDYEEIERLGVRHVTANLLLEGKVARHDSEKLAAQLLKLVR